jgi:hypothetical protein
MELFYVRLSDSARLSTEAEIILGKSVRVYVEKRAPFTPYGATLALSLPYSDLPCSPSQDLAVRPPEFLGKILNFTQCGIGKSRHEEYTNAVKPAKPTGD